MSISYTPEEITEILNDYFSGITHKQYIGARYVPIFGRKDEDSIIWDNTGTYEPLTIVLYQGNSYTSRQYVPIGVDITNEEYWALTGNYNAQVEQYRREVMNIAAIIPSTAFSAENTVKDYIDTTIDNYTNNDFKCVYHHSKGILANGKCDTSWILLAYPRDKVSMELHSPTGDDTLPFSDDVDPIGYAESNKDKTIITSFSPILSTNPSMRLNGTDYTGTSVATKFIAFDSNGTPEYFSVSTTNLANEIPAAYVTAVPSFDNLIDNGIKMPLVSPSVAEYNPRHVFGWDENYYYDLFTEGRGTLERGLNIQELQDLAYDLGIYNAVNMDGGGSTLCLLNTDFQVDKINKFRDLNKNYNNLRHLYIVNTYELNEGVELPFTFKENIENYKNGKFGYTDFWSCISLTGNNTGFGTTANTFYPIPSSSRTNKQLQQFVLPENYTWDATKCEIPLPSKPYFDHCVTIKGNAYLHTEGNGVTADMTMDIRTSLIKYVNGVEADRLSTRTRFNVPAGSSAYSVEIPYQNYWFINDENPECDYRVEVDARYVSGTFNEGAVYFVSNNAKVEIKEMII